MVTTTNRHLMQDLKNHSDCEVAIEEVIDGVVEVVCKTHGSVLQQVKG